MSIREEHANNAFVEFTGNERVLLRRKWSCHDLLPGGKFRVEYFQFSHQLIRMLLEQGHDVHVVAPPGRTGLCLVSVINEAEARDTLDALQNMFDVEPDIGRSAVRRGAIADALR